MFRTFPRRMCFGLHRLGCLREVSPVQRALSPAKHSLQLNDSKTEYVSVRREFIQSQRKGSAPPKGAPIAGTIVDVTHGRHSRQSHDYYRRQHEGGQWHSKPQDFDLKSSTELSTLELDKVIDFERAKEWLKHVSFFDIFKRASLYSISSYPLVSRYLIHLQRNALNATAAVDEKGLLKKDNFVKRTWNKAVLSFAHSFIFPTFCGGETIDSALANTGMLWHNGVELVLDRSMEEATGEDAFDANMKTKIGHMKRITDRAQTIATPVLREKAGVHPDVSDEDANVAQVFRLSALKLTALMNGSLLEKVSAVIRSQYPDAGGGNPLPFLCASERFELEAGIDRCARVVEAALSKGIELFIDAEQWPRNPAVNFVARELMRRYPNAVYNTYQMYLKDAPKWVRFDLSEAQRLGYTCGVKLVRGAYMVQEKEMALSDAREYPVCDSIEATHRQFDEALVAVLQHSKSGQAADGRRLKLAVCTHNRKSLQILAAECSRLGIDPRAEHGLVTGQLLGMCDHMAFAMKHAGFRSFKLAVFGSFEDIWPYLMRRLEENSEMLAATTKENYLFWRALRQRLRLP